MEIDRSLLKEFAQITNDSQVESENKYLRGTIVKNSGGKYVQLDGSTTVTPISGIVDAEEGDRVLVSIENHKATIIGNFSFPPSARKEQEAISKAETAQGSADNANETANAAQIKAQEASNKADTAIDQSSIASASADEAKEQAASAITTANTASTSASEAKELATQANTSASEAKDQAAASQAASANAQAEVTRLNGEVTAAKEDIDAALEELETQAGEIAGIKTSYATKVEVGNTKAELETTITEKVGELETTISETYSTKTENVELEGKLQTQITQNAEGLNSQATKIEKLESDTTQAQLDVADALSKASAAQTAASEAQTKADAAQTAADAASANATAATEKATIAQNAADAAQAAANAADAAVQSAQSDLNEAKQNLATVTSRVDATEADIAEAQSKVDAAQTAVNEALADAAEANLAATKAQEAADKAQLDAETAQGAAATAQQKADNAQTAANNAQAAADQAQADVAALTKRVTTAETNISQNSEKIELNANKIVETGEKIDNLEIGGRNLLRSSSNPSQPYFDTIVTPVSNTTFNKCSVQSSNWAWGGISFDFKTQIEDRNFVEVGDTFTYSIWAKISDEETLGINVKITADGTLNGENNRYIDTTDSMNDSLLTKEWKRFYYTFTVPAERLSEQNGSITRLRFEQNIASSDGCCVMWACPKLEKGNKPTDWSPSPEDIEDNLNENYYTKTETDAKIKVESDKISSTVTRVETVEKTVNGIQIGGTQLLRGTNSVTKLTSTGTWNNGTWRAASSGTGTRESIEVTDSPNSNVKVGWHIASTNGQVMIAQDNVFTSNGQEYTMSCYARGTGKVQLQYGNDTVTYQAGETTIDSTTEWKRCSFTFTSKGEGNAYFGVSTAGYDIYICGMKLEKGNIATDWSEAIDNIIVGGRNLLVETAVNKSIDVNSSSGYVVFDPYSTNNKQTLADLGLKSGDEVAISFNWSISQNGDLDIVYGNFRVEWYGVKDDSSNGYLDVIENPVAIFSSTNTSGEAKITTILTDAVITAHTVRFRIDNSVLTFSVSKIKLEIGNSNTDWTPAPEDIDSSIANVEDTMDNRFSEVDKTIQAAQSSIDQLANMISHLITDNNGGSLMTQTDDGWTFNMSSITGNLDAIKEAIADMDSEQSETSSAIDKLTNLINEVANKTAYITMATDDNGNPCIELGKTDSTFKVRITNTAIDFLEGSTKIAYANNNTFYTEKLIVKNELQIGEGPGFVWRTRANGNMGLVYISG